VQLGPILQLPQLLVRPVPVVGFEREDVAIIVARRYPEPLLALSVSHQITTVAGMIKRSATPKGAALANMPCQLSMRQT
jgi:hypothetical protein